MEITVDFTDSCCLFRPVYRDSLLVRCSLYLNPHFLKEEKKKKSCLVLNGSCSRASLFCIFSSSSLSLTSRSINLWMICRILDQDPNCVNCIRSEDEWTCFHVWYGHGSLFFFFFFLCVLYLSVRMVESSLPK